MYAQRDHEPLGASPAPGRASMGPGVVRREGKQGRRPAYHPRHASMGPGVVRREGPLHGAGGAAVGGGFNGARRCTPGRGGKPVHVRHADDGFNGARRCTPGRARRVSSGSARSATLQWGPALYAGKGLASQQLVDAASSLQWGPALYAGKGGLHRHRPDPARAGFNGARRCTPGRGPSTFSGRTYLARLQWGPALYAGKGGEPPGQSHRAKVRASMGPGVVRREGAQRPSAVVPVAQASMGPGVVRREGLKERKWKATDSVLQWGPALYAGKGSFRAGLRACSGKLQWGPALYAGKGWRSWTRPAVVPRCFHGARRCTP